MDALLPILIIPIVVAAIIVFAIAAHRAAVKRREELAALARDLGWSFDPGHDASHDEQYAHFEMFRRGHSRAAYNTLSGAMTIHGRDWPAKMGDFTYKITTHSGKSTTTRTYRFSYLIVHLPYANVPDLLIRAEGVLDKIAGAFGFDDIDFESAEFSRRFHVKSADKRFAYDVIDPRMMEFLLATRPPIIDIEQRRMCISDARTCWTTAQFRTQMNWIGQFFDAWPEHVKKDLAARA